MLCSHATGRWELCWYWGQSWMSWNAGCCSDTLLPVSFLHWELLLAHNKASSHLEQTGIVQHYYKITWDWKLKISALEQLFSYKINFTYCMPRLSQNELAKHQVWLTLIQKCCAEKILSKALLQQYKYWELKSLREQRSQVVLFHMVKKGNKHSIPPIQPHYTSAP